MVSESFERALRGSREELNARFAEARQQFPALSADAFTAFLREAVDPLVQSVDAVCPERADAVGLAAYGIALELVGQRLVGAGAPDTAVESTWRTLLPAMPQLLAAEPSRVIASMTNAAHQVGTTPNANAAAWVNDVTRLAPDCGGVDELLRVGQVAAWRAGLAHFRQGAIGAAAALPETLAVKAVAAPASSRWADIEAGLRASEWFDPAKPDGPDRKGALRQVATIGAFRGLGGQFIVPPRVTRVAGNFHVLSGDETWLLTADLYGATFHRLVPNETAASRPVATIPPATRLPDGPGTVTSVASSKTTLAVTWSLTHRIMLFALS